MPTATEAAPLFTNSSMVRLLSPKELATSAVSLTAAPDEQVEGLDDREGESWGDYPLDTLLIRNDSKSVFEIVRRINSNGFVMDPEFQREFVWTEEKQSKLIESVLMRIPLPVFYLAEDAQGRRVVVDGLQRLTTFTRFLNGELRLRLKDQPKLDGRTFKELEPRLQSRVEDCSLILYLIDAKVPERARLDIFERVNSGELLTRQQMRNSLYCGPATRFLKAEASTGLFVDSTGRSVSSDAQRKAMRDREFVNRFCAFQLLNVDDYRDMDDFLANALKAMNSHANANPTEKFERLSQEFRLGLANNYFLFERHAFRKHQPQKTERAVLNASLWDVMITGLSRVPSEQVKAKRDQFRDAFFGLLRDDRFDKSITRGPNAASEVKHRFAASRAMIKEVFGADAN